MKKWRAFCFLLIVSCQSYALTAIPFFDQRVVDTSQTLTTAQIDDLESKLIEFERPRTDGAQIAVLIVSTLDGETIEQYATRVFDNWQIGKQGRDNGILLLIVKNDKLMRIEVGYGLEGTIPDLTASRIIREQLAPQFKQDNYYQGIQDALLVLMQKIDNPTTESENDDELTFKTLFASEFGSVLLHYGVFSFIICFFVSRFLPINKLKKSAGQSLGTGLLNGVSVGGFTLFSGYSLQIALPLLFLAFVASTILSGILTMKRGNSSGSNNDHRGGFGGNSHGGGFGGGSGSGGFGGGGGGRSGGGGASGGW